MEIRKIEGLENTPLNRSVPSKQIPSSINNVQTEDSVYVSKEAHLMEDEAFIADVLSRIPDMDIQKMEQIKEQLSSGKYDHSSALDIVAEKILQALGENI